MLQKRHYDHALSAPAVFGTQLRTPLLDGASPHQKREELKRYFDNTWKTYESLFALINDDSAYYLRPEPLRHPLIFYFGHTAVFYINKFMLGKYIPARLDEKLESICAVGVDEMSWDDLDSSHYEWPSVAAVRAYRDKVHDLIMEMIDTMELRLPITQDSLAWVILMGCEHERIHLETSSVIMRMLSLDYLDASSDWPACDEVGPAPANPLLPVAGGRIELGKPDSVATYGWDNEYGEGVVDVPDFRAAKFLVSNGEYMAFVDAGGYRSERWWTEEGQGWLAYTQAQMPRFWLKRDGRYYQRNLSAEIPLPLDWPVEVNYLEAKAFCNWKAAETGTHIRLPSEAEWYAMRKALAGDITDWRQVPGNLHLEYFASSCPVNYFDKGGLNDIVGNVWQWTETAIDAFNGFKVHPLYDDFSTPTFDGKHNLIKGGSWISTGNEATEHSRYAFRRHFFQHAGFRYIEGRDEKIPDLPVNRYETNDDVCAQLACHYGDDTFGVANYAQQLVNAVSAWLDKYGISGGRLLDLGCSVGRVSFHLATRFAHVDAVDFSARYIQHGVQLQQGGRVRYVLENQGEIVDYREVALAHMSPGVAAENILFSQGDGANLKPIYRDYDLVLVQQALEKSYDPALVLANLRDRVKSGGFLLILSDYAFDEQVTEKAKWLGGVKINGENVTGFDALSEHLAPWFDFMEDGEILRAVPVSLRKAELSQQHLTLWRRKPHC
ncbi:MAG: 5-histidylcysteine sulfoxide synthase [Porticoccaceae bacterium]